MKIIKYGTVISGMQDGKPQAVATDFKFDKTLGYADRESKETIEAGLMALRWGKEMLEAKIKELEEEYEEKSR